MAPVQLRLREPPSWALGLREACEPPGSGGAGRAACPGGAACGEFPRRLWRKTRTPTADMAVTGRGGQRPLRQSSADPAVPAGTWDTRGDGATAGSELGDAAGSEWGRSRRPAPRSPFRSEGPRWMGGHCHGPWGPSSGAAVGWDPVSSGGVAGLQGRGRQAEVRRARVRGAGLGRWPGSG